MHEDVFFSLKKNEHSLYIYVHVCWKAQVLTRRKLTQVDNLPHLPSSQLQLSSSRPPSLLATSTASGRGPWKTYQTPLGPITRETGDDGWWDHRQSCLVPASRVPPRGQMRYAHREQSGREETVVSVLGRWYFQYRDVRCCLSQRPDYLPSPPPTSSLPFASPLLNPSKSSTQIASNRSLPPLTPPAPPGPPPPNTTSGVFTCFNSTSNVSSFNPNWRARAALESSAGCTVRRILRSMVRVEVGRRPVGSGVVDGMVGLISRVS
ncbi:uncharacterized protein EV422DRAFT_533476 [Fimicolochytrium jonesii]|uniref:uncharacterized protein n=1 Tax=Fimicolochytrium jonesii TaxID=1396493 RepID=UPI0022FDB832|nr:uncharacterized protein EV422DRAFT_533476 [Fimicolochytrium jonesii]KAI8819562.1 hypothetical protein EV422DRAFT_533476 [Fimicolochytrium jonesii]